MRDPASTPGQPSRRPRMGDFGPGEAYGTERGPTDVEERPGPLGAELAPRPCSFVWNVLDLVIATVPPAAANNPLLTAATFPNLALARSLSDRALKRSWTAPRARPRRTPPRSWRRRPAGRRGCGSSPGPHR